MKTKIEQLRSMWIRGDQIGALRMAAKFPRLGDEREAITRGWEASRNPAFYRQIGRDPEALVDAGIEALVAKYAL
jgi:hypothetical protein